ncbi:MAG TPA: ADP-forming succinate--CoA ligase subunit beta [Aggregatilineales bacterium]|nr:ADP-forming succinate--CoA ligase subunit beta [Chloroflexota bacterium]HPV07042.1 ADP-forming succinate--CoA ligase subunit beta [Aggregatilineales bacterium]HQA67366.1 ADP-forming succinate--CoA ligase subunit beta [Aggregatilineales bacterium]
MKLHEYQSKFRFAEFGIPIPRGKIATTPEEAFQIAKEIGGPTVVKAQVLVGGRGKAGGVKLARTPEEAEQHAASILGMNIKGLTVKKVLIDPAADIRTEIYLGVTTDRTERRTVVMASSEGGMDIEEVAAKSPDKIAKVWVHPFLGLRDYQARDIANAIGLPREHWREFIQIAKGLYDAYVQSDATLAEINPLVITGEGSLLAVDGKMVLDDNALFRHPQLAEMRDTDEEAPAETRARNAGLSFVKLNGEIGCMVNGAGLAMTTMDMIKLFGGEPANFLDIGGGAQADKVATAMQIILDDPNVKAVLINIFGGITRADEVARGVVEAIEKVKPNVPFVARLVGTNEAEGREILNQANMITATSLAEAAKLAVEAAQSAS